MGRQATGGNPLRGGCKVHVDDHINTPSIAEGFQAFQHGLCFVKNSFNSTRRFGMCRFFFRAHCSNNLTAKLRHHLCDVMPHSRRCASDQNFFATQIFVACQMHCLHSGQTWNAHTSTGCKICVVGQLHRLYFRQHNGFGGRAVRTLPLRIPNPNTFAHALLGHTLTHRFNSASAIAVRHHPRVGQGPCTARLHIGRIDTRGGQTHAHLTSARCFEWQ